MSVFEVYIANVCLPLDEYCSLSSTQRFQQETAGRHAESLVKFWWVTEIWWMMGKEDEALRVVFRYLPRPRILEEKEQEVRKPCSSFFTLLPQDILNAGMLTLRHTTLRHTTLRHTTLRWPDEPWTPKSWLYIPSKAILASNTSKTVACEHREDIYANTSSYPEQPNAPFCDTQVPRSPKPVHILGTKFTMSWSASSQYRCVCCAPSLRI